MIGYSHANQHRIDSITKTFTKKGKTKWLIILDDQLDQISVCSFHLYALWAMKSLLLDPFFQMN